MERTASKVPFTKAEAGLCMCPKCPVQAASDCVKNKVSGIKDALQKEQLERADIPGVYCSTGTATCTDLDPGRNCICGGCAVFSQHGLAAGTPVGYYCRDGSAS